MQYSGVIQNAGVKLAPGSHLYRRVELIALAATKSITRMLNNHLYDPIVLRVLFDTQTEVVNAFTDI